MTIKIAGKRINKSAPVQEVVPAPQPQPAVNIVDEFPSPPKRVVFDRKPTPKITDGNTLIVNGKAKTIGRKSQYLLDMMIIDDE